MRTARSLALLAVPALATALVVPLATGPASAATPTRTYALDSSGPAAEDVYPEGVAVVGDTYYTGSTTDGTVYRGSLDGGPATVFLAPGGDGRTSAIGLKATEDRLFVAGGATGLFLVYAADGTLLRRYSVAPVASTASPTFLNDVAVAPDGDLYVTDSRRSFLYRIPAEETRTAAAGTQTLQPFLDFTGTALQYGPGFNANGIVIDPSGRYAVVASGGALYRIGLADRSVVKVEGVAVQGDGLVLQGRTLYAVTRAPADRVAVVRLAGDLASGEELRSITDPTFKSPTTAALVGGRLLVVNSQFAARATQAADTTYPFTLSLVKP